MLLLLGILGQFLEGPPTRVVVRSGNFVFFCFAMSLCAAHFLHKVKKIHITVFATQGLLVPGGYIYMAQSFYNGGKNMDLVLPLLFFTLLMTMNGLVFLRSLFSLPLSPQPKSRTISSHEVTLYTLHGDKERGKIVFHEKGQGALPETILLDGYSRMIGIDLKPYWHKIMQDQLTSYTTSLTTYETIIKFGTTQQLVDEYEIVFKLTNERSYPSTGSGA